MDIGLERLMGMVLDMANLSEDCVKKSIEMYAEGTHLEEEVFDKSEKLRFLQNEVDDMAIEIIARYQPVSSDLRFLRSSMDIAYGFQRFGRYAYDIAQVLKTAGDVSSCSKDAVISAAEQVTDMVEVSKKVFAKRDVELAKTLAKMDDVIDEMYNSYIKKIMDSKNFETTKCVVSATLILRYLERIADHAVYIGDAVTYIVTGESMPRL